MNTTDALDIYDPGNAAAWERAVRDALDKVRPGMGEAAELSPPGTLWAAIPDSRLMSIRMIRGDDHTHVTIRSDAMSVGGIRFKHADPAEALRLALCAYRRAVEGVSDAN